MFKLPQRLRPLIEAVFGTALDEVRLHISDRPSLIGARAFAQGDDIHVAPQFYDTESRAGVALLGHELAHVIQQRAGRVAGRGELIVEDAQLETEADWGGRCLAEAVESGRWLLGPVFAPVKRRATGAGGVIQCIMTYEEFKAASSAPGPRNKIVPVDEAVKRYNSLIKAKPVDWDALYNQSKTIRTACTTYTGLRPNSGRQAGVDELMRQIAAEEAILSCMDNYKSSKDLGEKWDRVENAHETFLRVRDRVKKVAGIPNVFDILSTERTSLADQIKASPIGSAIVMGDIQELKLIAASADTPDVLKAVIREVTASQNTQQLDYSFNSPSAKYNITRGSTRKYTLNHMIEQSEGKKFRLGSLLHELTHVSIAETFGNSVIMLACPPEASDDEMMQLVRLRKASILNMLALVEQAATAQPGGSADVDALSERQKKELRDKLNYVLDQNQTDKYLNLLRGFGKVTTVDQRMKDKQVALADRVRQLIGEGLRNELTEYDPVINQATLWCHLWRLHPRNSAYAALRNLAQLAASYRAAAKGRRKKIVSPLTQVAVDRKPGRRLSIG
jgi:hypothetical protein